MKKSIVFSAFLTLTIAFGAMAQDVKPEEKKREPGHYNENKFRQMYDEMALQICSERLLELRTSVLSTKADYK